MKIKVEVEALDGGFIVNMLSADEIIGGGSAPIESRRCVAKTPEEIGKIIADFVTRDKTATAKRRVCRKRKARKAEPEQTVAEGEAQP